MTDVAHNWEVFERPGSSASAAVEPCEGPSRYRYQRGCRCPGCKEASATYKRERAERAAQAEGRVHGEKPCGMCGEPVSTLNGAARKEFCDVCAAVRLRDHQAKDRDRRREQQSEQSEGTPFAGVAPATITDLPVDALTIGEDVRLDEDPQALAELAASIVGIGILQPLVVRTSDEGWEVIAGRRRLAAARVAELETVPCIIRELDDDQAFDATLAENLHRRDLSWIEVALAYDRLRTRGLKQTQIAALVGKTDSQVSQVLRLLTIPQELQDRVHRREISYPTALDLAKRGETTGRAGGASTKGQLTGAADAELATYWRRRHDRLVAGVVQIIRKQEATTLGLQTMLERLLKVDRLPLPDQNPPETGSTNVEPS